MAKKVNRTKASKAALGSTTRGVLGKSSGVRSIIPKKITSEEEKKEVIKQLINAVAMIPIEQIHANKTQPRTEFDQEALEELSSSIKRHGIIQPMTVRRLAEDEYQIISGERRWRASKLAGLKEVPAYIRIADDDQMFEMAIVENVQREDLNPLEMAFSLSKIKELPTLEGKPPLTDSEIAEKIGKRRSTVSNYLRVLVLSENIQHAVRDGDITVGHAKALAGLDPLKRQDFFTDTVEQNLSVRALEEKIKVWKEQSGAKKMGKAASSASKLPTEYQAVQRTLRDFFGNGKVAVKLKGENKGQIVVPFTSVEELNRMLDLLE